MHTGIEFNLIKHVLMKNSEDYLPSCQGEGLTKIRIAKNIHGS